MIYNVLVAEPSNDKWTSIADGVRRRWPEAAMVRVKDGEQAIRFLFERGLFTDEPDTPHLVLLASELSIVPAEDVIARLRQHPRTQAMPVIVVGRDEQDDTPMSQEWLEHQQGVVVITGTTKLHKKVADAVNLLSATQPRAAEQELTGTS